MILTSQIHWAWLKNLLILFCLSDTTWTLQLSLTLQLLFYIFSGLHSSLTPRNTSASRFSTVPHLFSPYTHPLEDLFHLFPIHGFVICILTTL